MFHRYSNKRKIIIVLIFLILICLAVALWPKKVNYTADESVPFSDFTIKLVSSKESTLKFGEMNEFYTAVWNRTANDLQDCSTKSDAYVGFRNAKDECERVNGDIKRDLASKAGIEKYLNENKRVDIAYKITSKNDNFDVSDVKLILVSGEEDLSLKTFDYEFIYKSEVKNRIANNISTGTLTKDLSRSGTMWADVKKQTSDLVMKIEYYNTVKTITFPANFNN